MGVDRGDGRAPVELIKLITLMVVVEVVVTLVVVEMLSIVGGVDGGGDHEKGCW